MRILFLSVLFFTLTACNTAGKLFVEVPERDLLRCSASLPDQDQAPVLSENEDAHKLKWYFFRNSTEQEALYQQLKAGEIPPPLSDQQDARGKSNQALLLLFNKEKGKARDQMLQSFWQKPVNSKIVHNMKVMETIFQEPYECTFNN